MADSWEDEADEIVGGSGVGAVAASAVLASTDKWEGEDEDDVPDAWDAEPAPASDDKKKSESSSTTTTASSTKPKKRSKQLAAAADKKKQEADEKHRQLAAEATASADGNVGIDTSSLSKEELRRIQEEADLLVAKDTFGISDTDPAALSVDPQKSIDLLQPKSKADFDNLGRLISHKLRQFETSPHYANFVESLFRDCTLELDSESLRKLSTMFSALATEKNKLEKASAKGKKKSGKGVVKVERDAASAGAMDDDYGYDDYDDFI